MDGTGSCWYPVAEFDISASVSSKFTGKDARCEIYPRFIIFPTSVGVARDSVV